MFFPRTVTLELAESQLRGMRISLNTPVVATEELAVGPARAGLLVHLEPDGRPNVTIGIRSLRSGEVVLYSFEGDLREHSSLDVGVDAGLSFAESMGFLFDEDELGAGDADAIGRCMGLWNDLMGTSGAGNFVSGELSPDAPSEPIRGVESDSPDEPFATADLGVSGAEALPGACLELPGAGPLSGAEGKPAAARGLPPADAPDGYIPQFEGDLGGNEINFADGLDPDEIGVDLGISARSFEFAEGAPEPAQPGIALDPGKRPLEPMLALDLGAEAVELGPAVPVEEPVPASDADGSHDESGAPSAPDPLGEPGPSGDAALAASSGDVGASLEAPVHEVTEARVEAPAEALRGVSGEAPAVGLSKFRANPAPDAARRTPLRDTAPDGLDAARLEAARLDAGAEEASRRTELARVRLVRKGGGGSRRPHPIIRLLGAF